MAGDVRAGESDADHLLGIAPDLQSVMLDPSRRGEDLRRSRRPTETTVPAASKTIARVLVVP